MDRTTLIQKYNAQCWTIAFGTSDELRTAVLDLKLDNYMKKEDHCIFREKNKKE